MSGIPTRFALSFVALAAVLGSAAPAAAHGGRLPTPVKPPPDRMPDPYHPTPADGGSPTTPPGTPLPPPTLPPPTTPPVTPEPNPGEGGKPRGPRSGQASVEGWRDWWTANGGEFLLRPPRATRVTADNPLFEIGGAPDGNRSDADRLGTLAVEREVLPTLRWAADSATRLDPDATASAWLAIGKTARGPEDVRLLLRAAGRDDLPDLTHESAVLALGLLRRSDPEAALDPETLDDAREACLAVLDDPRRPTRTRAYAALALGLLGDQRSGRTSSADRDGRWVVRETWTRLRAERGPDDVPVALLTALSLQDPTAVPTGVVDSLRALASTGRLEGRRKNPVVQAQAALALARLSPDGAPGVLLAIVHARSSELLVRRAAVVALGAAAPSLPPPVRAETAEALARTVEKGGDPDTKGLALIAIARLLAADLGVEGVAVLESRAFEAVLDGIERGVAPLRPLAAIAAGVALRAVPEARSPDALLALRVRAVTALREGVQSPNLDPSTRGAFCMALGLARDAGAVPALGALASRRENPDDLRADACTGLGLVGTPTPETVALLRRAVVERSSDELRRQAAVALGLLGDASAAPLLLEDLRSGGSDHVLGQVVLGLATIGDASSAAPLARIVRDRAATDLLRALACAGLGCLADREPVPSLSRLGTASGYPVVTDAVQEALSIL